VSFIGQFVRHPQQLWIRRANFQIHLWAGIILALYLTVIGITGSILVFGAELGRVFDASPWPGLTVPPAVADLAVVIENVSAQYPHTHIISVMAPTRDEPVFKTTVLTRPRVTLASHPVTGAVIGEIHRRQSKLDWIYRLHEDLLAGRKGRIVNGIGAAALILLLLTGLINWWPGIKQWPRALKVDFRRKWKRINYDLHSAAGFWTLSFLVMWAITGVYFAWPANVLSYVDKVSPTVNILPGSVFIDPNTEMQRPDFHAMLVKAYRADPGTTWKGLIFPSNRRTPFEMLMSRAPGVGRDYEDTLYFNPYNGEYISTWQYGVNKSAGDWFIWLQIPLHFGTHWGLAVKCLWALMGLALPLLAISGLLMYWNRFLGKLWKRSLQPRQALVQVPTA
jgi:uncharacterized iron-regulated membrane protein